MPRSAFARELVVPAGPPVCWQAVTDVPLLVGWVSVIEDAAEITPLAAYRAVLADRLGPFKLRADLDIALTDVRDGEHLHMAAAGEDRQVGSRLAVEADLDVLAGAGGTVVRIAGEYEVAGKAAGIGGATIRKKADRILDEFFGKLAAHLGGG